MDHEPAPRHVRVAHLALRSAVVHGCRGESEHRTIKVADVFEDDPTVRAAPADEGHQSNGGKILKAYEQKTPFL